MSLVAYGYLLIWLFGRFPYSIVIVSIRSNVAKRGLPGRARPAGLPTRTREYLISWPMGARLMAISRRLVAIWLLAIWLYGLRVWWPKLLAMWLT